eukprot:gene19210-25061_t
MDEEDELVPDPDDRGLLDLTNRAWVHIDPIVFKMSMKLVTLDISYNHITEIPAQIQELVLLRELRASFNKISSIAPEIGKLKRIKRLYLNSNRLTIIPSEIGRLDSLEELILSENSIEEIPDTLALMSALRILKLQNNYLSSIPGELSNIFTLEEIDCSNNRNLTMIPHSWRGDTESILFICRIHRDYNTKMEEMVATNNDLSKHSQFLEQEQLIMREKIGDLKHQIDQVISFLPKRAKQKYDLALKQAADEAAGNNNKKLTNNENKCTIQ